MTQGTSFWQFVLHPIRGLSVLVAVITLVLMTAPVARAQTYTVLHSFCSQTKCMDGDRPNGPLIQATNGNLYGTTDGGGTNGGGTVFTITPGALTTLYSFCTQPNCTDGHQPNGALIQATNGDLYGTTYLGGTNSQGTVFTMTPSGALTALYSFFCIQGPGCGYRPNGPLIQATNGNLYGTTQGSTGGDGTVFTVTPSGTLTTLSNFGNPNGPDGSMPNGPLIQATDGNLYGTSRLGGTHAFGAVFKLTPSGVLTTLYSFCSQEGGPVPLYCTDGSLPEAALIQATDGDFYGTTPAGGPNGVGTVFKLTPSGTLTTLYSFCSQPSCTDGSKPDAALFQATNGNLYGTTSDGGGCNTHKCGTAFMLNVGLGPFVALQTTSGEVGATVKILGTSLTGATKVTFNGTPATFTVNTTGTAIAATVPTGATTGTVQVVTPNGTLNSNVVYTVK